MTFNRPALIPGLPRRRRKRADAFLFFALIAIALGYLGFNRERADARTADTGPDLQDRLAAIVHEPDSLVLPAGELLH